MSSIKIFRDNDASTVFVAQGVVGTFPYNCLRAVGNGDGTLSVKNLAKVYPDGSDFFEVSDRDYADFVDDTGTAWGGSETAVVNALNAIFASSGGAGGNAPVITSSLAVALTAGNTLNYELTATDGVGYEWDNLPTGVTTVEGNIRKLIGGSGLAPGTYNITAKAINYYGVDTETVVLTVSSPAFSDTYSVNFNQSDYLTATASTSNPFYRTSNGAGSGDAWSVSFWFKGGSSNNQNQTIVGFGGNDADNEGQVWIRYNAQTTNDRLVLQYGSNNNRLVLETPNGSITPGTWEHWLVTYDGGTTGSASGDISNYYSRFSIYKNGVAQATTNSHNNYGWSSSVPADLFYIARRPGTGSYLRNNSRIDELAIWASDESSNAAAIYNSGSTHDLSALGSPPDHWYRMGDGDTYPTIQDSIASLDLTMTNMTAADIVSDVP